MEIKQLELKDLIPYANNPRKKQAIDKVASSIKEFGWQQPIVVDEEMVIVVGHTRYQAAQKLGLDKVPVQIATGLTDAQIKAYRLLDNRANQDALWDDDMLKIEVQDIDKMDIDLALTGFDEKELDKLLFVEQDGLTDEDAVPEDVEPRVKKGELWQLGNHRLLCGDATSEADVAKLMDNQKADMVFTDPPYLIQTEGGCNGSIGKGLKKQDKDIKFISDFNPINFLKLLPIVFDKKYFNAYVFCNKDLLPDYLVWAKENGLSFNPLIWKKPTAIPIGGSHRPDIEFLLLFRKNAKWNGALKNVNYSRLMEYGRETGLHPTMKPVSLIENQMLISSNRNNLIMDFFLGSGSTLIACEKTNRNCYGLELDPKYCDVIIKRWEDFTGQTAKLLERGTDTNSFKEEEKWQDQKNTILTQTKSLN
jgi:DNA modification methylase